MQKCPEEIASPYREPSIWYQLKVHHSPRDTTQESISEGPTSKGVSFPQRSSTVGTDLCKVGTYYASLHNTSPCIIEFSSFTDEFSRKIGLTSSQKWVDTDTDENGHTEVITDLQIQLPSEPHIGLMEVNLSAPSPLWTIPHWMPTTHVWSSAIWPKAVEGEDIFNDKPSICLSSSFNHLHGAAHTFTKYTMTGRYALSKL